MVPEPEPPVIPEPFVSPLPESPPLAAADLVPVAPPAPVVPPPPERTKPRTRPVPSTPPAAKKPPASSPASNRPAGPPLPPSMDRLQTAEGNALGEKSQEAPSTPIEGGAAGAGNLFAQGDVPVVPGPGTGGGSGGPGSAGLGFAAEGRGTQGGGLRPGAGGTTPGGGDVEIAAQPLGGGYQVKPHYPYSARRRGIEGTVVLKVLVTEQGLVEVVQVERSAGHADLDQSAVEAVRRWRFQPARRHGGEPVAMWVLIPVQYKLL